MTGVPTLPTSQPSADLKTQLVQAASEILEKEGLGALSLRAAARASGVSHMAPYRHFESKDALLAAVAERGFQALSAQMSAAAAAAGEAADPLARFFKIGRAYVDFAQRFPALYRLMFGPVVPFKHEFDGLSQACDTAFNQCAAAVADCLGDALPAETAAMAEQCHSHAIGAWSLVHGLASILIDGLVEVPEDVDGFEQQLIDDILRNYLSVFRATP